MTGPPVYDYAPQERWIVLYWDTRADRGGPPEWVLGVAQPVGEAEARDLADQYRRELGRRRVRVLHTADG